MKTCSVIIAEALWALSLLSTTTGLILHSSKQHALRKSELKKASGCPAGCTCQAGDNTNGGTAAVEAMCYDYCSAPHYNGTSSEAVRYCGTGYDYYSGDSLDCTKCLEPQYFNAKYTLHQPTGPATQSIILLGPWNASEDWGMQWTMNISNTVDPSIKLRSRFLDAIGRPASMNQRGEPYIAWYGYGDYEAWYNNIPLAREVDHAVAWVHSLIEQEFKVVGDYRRIAIIGLHQGGNLALESGLRFPHPLGLVVAERSVLIPSRTANFSAVAATPYILTATGRDAVYTADWVQNNANYLKSIHASVHMKTVPDFDHFMWSEEESQLILRSLSLSMNHVPLSSQLLAPLTQWNVAS